MTLWQTARARGPRRRSLARVWRANEPDVRSTSGEACHSALCGTRTTAGTQEVEQRMEQLPSRKSVNYGS